MKIGSLTLENNTILAPLAGITNLPFRLLAKEAGCGMVCSEMISSHGLVYKSEKTFKMLDSTPEEKPLSIQLFGAKPDIMAEAAAIVESSGADVVDINFGCSVKKVVKTGAGVALMRNYGSIDMPAWFREAGVPIRAINAAAPNPTRVENNRKYADFDVVLIEDVGHYLQMTRPDEFNRLMVEAIAEIVGG